MKLAQHLKAQMNSSQMYECKVSAALFVYIISSFCELLRKAAEKSQEFPSKLEGQKLSEKDHEFNCTIFG